MKIELTIDRMKKLPVGAIPALESELLKRLSKQFDGCQITIKRASNDGLTVFGATRKRSNISCRRLGKARTSGFINRVNLTGAVSKSIAVCVPWLFPITVCRVNKSLWEIVCSADAFNADDQWYDVVRRADNAVIYSFPAEGRYLVYRVNGIVSLRPLLEEEEIFTLNGFMQFAKRLGYRITPPSDIILS